MTSQSEQSEAALQSTIEQLRRRVAELEKSRQALLDEKRQTALLIDSLPQRIFFKDVESRLVRVNLSFCNVVGLSPEEVVGKTDLDLFPEDLAEKYRSDDRKVMESRETVTLVERQVRGGKEYINEVTKAPVIDEDGNVIGLMGIFSDVTDRKRTEKALRYERFLLHAFMDNIPDSVFFKDLKLRFTRINHAFAKRLNLDSPNDAVGKTDFDFFDRTFAEQTNVQEQQVLETGKPILGREEEQSWPDGRRSWVSLTEIPLVDDKGRTVGLIGVARDINERKAAEKAAVRSRQLLNAFLENSPAVIYVKDRAGRYLLVNRRCEQLIGLARQEIIGKTDFEVLNEETAKQLQVSERRVVDERRPIEIEVQIPHTDGVHTYMALKFPLFDNKGVPNAVCGILTDISERKASESALRDSEARKGAILESALDCVITLDHEGRITEFNPAAEKTFGYVREDVMNKEFVELIYPREVSERKRVVSSVASAGGSLIGNRIDSIAKRANGSTFPSEMAMTHLIVDGKPCFTVYLRDITERKAAEQELQKQAKLLSKQAAELEARNKDLRKAYEELQEAEAQLIHSEKIAAVGQLIAGLAHEINNPAAFVLTNLTVINRDLQDIIDYWDACGALEEKAKQVVPEEARKLADLRENLGLDETRSEIFNLIKSAKGGMERIRDLVANLRSYTRIDVRGDYGVGDLAEGIQATLLMLKPLIRDGVAVETDLGELPSVECNLGQINQVFMNLISNALQAVDDNGVVKVSAHSDDSGVVVEVADNGPGIPEKIKSRIFDPFFTTKEVGKGTGLGLSISRRIIDAHGGQLAFKSKEGVGTTFSVKLPLRQKPNDEAEQE